MSIERLIEELEGRGLVSDRVVLKLREKVAESKRPLSAKAVAKFLVEKDHITQRQASEVLDSLSGSGINVEATPGIAIEPPQVEQLRLSDAPLADDDSPDGSSIFEPFLSENRPTDVDEDVDLGLAPTSDAPPLAVRAPSEAPDVGSPEEEDVEPPPEKVKKSSRRKSKTERSDDEQFGLPAIGEAATKKKRDRDFAAALDEKKPRRGRKKLEKPKSEWDSPLIMWGGGGLVLMIIAGITIYYLLYWETGDDKLRLAQESVAAGSYSQAITEYKDFLERFPSHKDRSIARVQLGMVRLRKAVEAGDFEGSLAVAQEELEEIESEEKFSEARAELSALLPRIALGLAKEAEASEDAAKSRELVEKANEALALTSNTNYVPKSLRDEGELGDVREILARVERRQQSQQHLEEALAAMEKAVAEGETRAAYAAHVAFVKQHPDLAATPALREMVQKTTAAEQAAIRFTKEEQPAETDERAKPWLASLAVANRRVEPPAGQSVPVPDNAVAAVQIDGAVYGLGVASGKLLWRRYVGPGAAAPQLVGNDIIVADTTRQELLRLDARNGQLQWRQSIGEAFSQPLVVGDRTFVAAESGRLYLLDLSSGARLGYLQFAQPLRSAPAIDRTNSRIYLAGDHSTLYSLSASDLACLGVYYLGHAEGAITKSPAAVLDKVALVENDGATTSRLRLFSTAENGAIEQQLSERRLTGLPSAAPFAAGRRLVVITDRGQIEVYDAGGQAEKALTPVATRVASGNSPLIRYAAITDRNIWVGDTQLTKFSILPAGNRLPVEAIENDFTGATFDHPLMMFGDVLVHVRRAKGRAGATVAATATAQGNALWETDLAVPPAGAPVVDESAKAIVLANAEGSLFRFDEAAIRSRIQDEPLAAQANAARSRPLTSSVDLGTGRAAFCAPGSDQLLLYNPALGPAAARWVQLAGPLASEVTALGEGIVAPLTVGQVFYLSAADGSSLATPFQPVLEPQKEWRYQPAGAVDDRSNRFVIADGEGKLYLVGLAAQPQPHLKVETEAPTGTHPIESRLIVLGDTATGVGGSSHLVRFQLPSLDPVGDSNLPAPVAWGPHRVGDMILLATAANELVAVGADGNVLWQAAVEHGDLAGAPLAKGDSLLLAYRGGMVERRSVADGESVAAVDLQHPLAAGPVSFLQRLVLVANDGTLLVVDQP